MHPEKFLIAGVWLSVAVATPAFGDGVAVGPQYDTTHVYVAPADVDRLAQSFVATFGGTATKQVRTTVTPTPSRTISEVVRTPAGSLSIFGFETPIPYPFGSERTGYLVTDLDAAVALARKAGADVLVEPFADPIGRDAIIEWPGGVRMQLYWHTKKSSSAPLETVPENRVYISADRADDFVRGFLQFSGGKVIQDEAKAPGIEIGRPNDSYRRVRIESNFGKLALFVTDGHLPYPYGRELTGYDVSDLAMTLAKAKAAGATVLDGPLTSVDRSFALVEFPGGYVAEIYSTRR